MPNTFVALHGQPVVLQWSTGYNIYCFSLLERMKWIFHPDEPQEILPWFFSVILIKGFFQRLSIVGIGRFFCKFGQMVVIFEAGQTFFITYILKYKYKHVYKNE